MTQANSMRKPAPRKPRSAFALTATAGAAALMFLVTDTAFAQATETITVTGIRRGIESAITLKKEADGVLEAISAEDLGKLPDSSVAESIARLPGVTAQRNKSTGKAQSVSVRGMSPDFNGGTLNGREQASTGDSRAVEFDQFPSELLSSAVIYKTPNAGLVGQGLASTIDLRTVRPLDQPKRAVAVNLRKQRTGVDSGAGEGAGERFSLSYVDQFADRKIGVALGFVRFKEDGAEQQKFNAWGGWAPEVSYNGQMVKTPGGFTADTEKTSAKREGLMAVLQYKPSKDFETSLDIFSSKGDFAISKKGLEGALGGLSAGGYDPSGQLINATIANGVATSGTFTKYKGVVRNHDEAVHDKLDSLGWNTKVKLGGWTGTADLSQSKVVRNSVRYETTAGQPGDSNLPQFINNVDTISYTGFNGNNFDQVKYTTGLDYSNPAIIKLTDSMGWSGGTASPQAGYVALPTVKDTINALRLTGKRGADMGPIQGIEFGANFTERDKSHTANEGRLVIKGSADPYAAVTAPNPGVAIAGTTGLKILSWNPQGSLGTIYDLPAKVDADILNKDWSVNEKVNTLFAKGDLDGKLFGMAYHGNVGVQLVHTNQSATGYNVSRANCTGNTPATCKASVITAGTSYDDVLPSLNMNFDAGSDQVIRLGAARVLARPSMADMRASVGFNIDNTQGTPILRGDGGNPYLKPFKADQIDLSYEKYLGGNKAYFAAAGFYKELKTYILRQGVGFNFAPYVTPGTPVPPGNVTQGIFTQPVNGTGGNISGIELTLSLPFNMVSKALDGFGVELNHSSTQSSISMAASAFSTNDVGTTKIPLPGLSKRVTNLTFYYEKHGFQFRVAQRERSDFLGEVVDFQDQRQLTYVKAEKILDAQIGYEMQSGVFKGLSVLLQANNLGNAEFRRYNKTPDNIVERVKFGKTYLLGVNYKL